MFTVAEKITMRSAFPSTGLLFTGLLPRVKNGNPRGGSSMHQRRLTLLQETAD
jgi:hypothetical protein